MEETPPVVKTTEEDIFTAIECFTPGDNKERLLIQHSVDEDYLMLEDPLQVGSGGRLAWAYGDDDLDGDEARKDETEAEVSTSISTSNSYRDEWLRLFERPDYISVIRKEGLNGRLRSSRFRSVCWRVYLEVLPEVQDQWITSVRNDREKYSSFKRKHVIDSQTGSKSREVDLGLNNPLSQDEESPWNKFFQDQESRQEISQDVKRTFPEIEFFQTDDMHDMMVNILFCYCKEHEDLCYKQGMHEVLAPLIFVLHCDQQAYLHAQELKSQIPVILTGEREVVQEIMDPNYLEHDSYMMFDHLMETMEPLYQHGIREDYNIPRNASFNSARPFSKPKDGSPSSPLIKKLTKIQEIVLKKHDSELHLHLSTLDIQPQIFGIRWIRLIFGREFTLQDLLVLWDTIFADSPTLDLIDYIFVAMLLLVRELLLSGDYADCMSLLMRFPMIGDVRCLVDKALHLRNPKRFPRPPNYQFQILQHSEAGVVIPSSARSSRRPYTNGTVGSMNSTSGGNFKNKKASVMTSGLSSLKRITNKGKQNEDKEPTYNQSPSHPLAMPTDSVTEVKSRPLKVKTPSTLQDTHMQSFSSEGIANLTSSSQNQKKENIGGLFSKTKTTGKMSQQKEHEADLYNQVSRLQGKMNDIQNMCRYCATKMEAHLMQMQDEMVKLKLTQEDEMLLAVAGLKQVKDILNGTLKFAQGMEEDEDLIINDDYFGTKELPAPTPSVNDNMDTSPESEPDSTDTQQPKALEMEEMDVSTENSGSNSEQSPSQNTSECNNNLSRTTELIDDPEAMHDGNAAVES